MIDFECTSQKSRSFISQLVPYHVEKIACLNRVVEIPTCFQWRKHRRELVELFVYNADLLSVHLRYDIQQNKGNTIGIISTRATVTMVDRKHYSVVLQTLLLIIWDPLLSIWTFSMDVMCGWRRLCPSEIDKWSLEGKSATKLEGVLAKDAKVERDRLVWMRSEVHTWSNLPTSSRSNLMMSVAFLF